MRGQRRQQLGLVGHQLSSQIEENEHAGRGVDSKLPLGGGAQPDPEFVEERSEFREIQNSMISRSESAAHSRDLSERESGPCGPRGPLTPFSAGFWTALVD